MTKPNLVACRPSEYKLLVDAGQRRSVHLEGSRGSVGIFEALLHGAFFQLPQSCLLQNTRWVPTLTPPAALPRLVNRLRLAAHVVRLPSLAMPPLACSKIGTYNIGAHNCFDPKSGRCRTERRLSGPSRWVLHTGE